MPGWMKWAVALAAGFAFIVLGWRLSDSRWFSWLLPTFFVVNCLFLIIVVLLPEWQGRGHSRSLRWRRQPNSVGPRGAATVLRAQLPGAR